VEESPSSYSEESMKMLEKPIPKQKQKITEGTDSTKQRGRGLDQLSSV